MGGAGSSGADWVGAELRCTPGAAEWNSQPDSAKRGNPVAKTEKTARQADSAQSAGAAPATSRSAVALLAS